MTTICALCSGLHDYAKGQSWYQWLCAFSPKESVLNPVDGSMTEPFERCRYVNNGGCDLYRAGPNVLHPKEGQSENV